MGNMEFILEDGTKMVLNKSEDGNTLIVEVYKDGEFLERSHFNAEDLYWKFF